MRWIIEYDDLEDKVSEFEVERWAKMAPGIMGPPINELRYVSAKPRDKPVDQDEEGRGTVRSS